MSNSLIQDTPPENMQDVHVRLQRIERGVETVLSMLQKLGNSSPHTAQVVNSELQGLRRWLSEHSK